MILFCLKPIKIMSTNLIRLADTSACTPRAAQQGGVIITWKPKHF